MNFKRVNIASEASIKRTLFLSQIGLNWRYVRIFLALFVAVFIIQIWIANRMSLYGEKMDEVKTIKARIELENQLLESRIFEKSSLMKMEDKARQWGFEDIKSIEYIK